MERYDISVVENATKTVNIMPETHYEKVVADCMTDYLEYRQAEEDGLLIKLPCRVGDTLYTFNLIKNEVIEFRAESKGYIVTILEHGALGITIFLTKSEAEQALAKMRGCKHEN